MSLRAKQVDPGRYQYIDALRGIAALLVVLFHVATRYSHFLSIEQMHWASLGAKGVQLFFVLSAFTLFLSLAKRTKTEAHPYISFFVRRFWRIAPLFYLSVVFYLWIYGTDHRWALGSHRHITYNNILATLLFANAFNPYWINSVVPVGWSVAVEITFYCIVPILFMLVKTKNQALLLFALSLLVCFASHGHYSIHPWTADRRLWDEFLFYWPPNQFPVFSLGIVLYYFVSEHKQKALVQQTSDKIKGRAGLFLSLAIIIGLVELQGLLPGSHILYGIGFSLLTYSLFLSPNKLFVNQFFCFTGKISYSIYLVHVLCLKAVKTVIAHFLDTTTPWQTSLLYFSVLSLLLTLIVSTVTYYLIEAPGQRLGSMIIKRLIT